MKKVITGILLVLAAVGGIFMVLVPHSEQEIIKTATPRHFRQLSAHATDTVSFPKGTNLLNVFKGNIYAYCRSESILYLADTAGGDHIPLLKGEGHFDEIPASIDVDSSGIWIYANNRKAIFHWLENRQQPDSINTSAHGLKRGMRLTDSLFIIHHFNETKGVAALECYNYRTGTLEREVHRFPKFNDHGMVSDGQLVRSPGNGIVYFYQHHNADIISWDPATGKAFTFQSIDSTRPFNSIIQHGESYSISSKSAFINVGGAADDRYVYILSMAVSDDSLTIGSYIDLYRATDGQYAGSLRIPPFNNQTVRLIQVENGKLYAGFRNNVLIYQLQLP